MISWEWDACVSPFPLQGGDQNPRGGAAMDRKSPLDHFRLRVSPHLHLSSHTMSP